MSNIPQEFFDRADAVIALANDQLRDEAHGKVSASTLYAASRFNAWVSATSCRSGADLRGDMDDILDYFTEQFRKMLKDNLEDYAENFDAYMREE